MFSHRRLVWGVIAFVFVMSLTGCSMPGSDSGDAAPVQEELNPASEPGQEDANPITAPTLDYGTPLPVNAERDACLEGEWIMPTDRLSLFVATMFPQTSSFLRVTVGFLSMSFTDEVFYYDGTYVLHVDSPDGSYSEATIDLFASGFYATENNDRLTFDRTVTQSNTTSCIAHKDGQTFSVPCASAGMTDILPPSTGPYLCSASELQIDVLSPSGEPITMFFER